MKRRPKDQTNTRMESDLLLGIVCFFLRIFPYQKFKIGDCVEHRVPERASLFHVLQTTSKMIPMAHAPQHSSKEFMRVVLGSYSCHSLLLVTLLWNQDSATTNVDALDKG